MLGLKPFNDDAKIECQAWLYRIKLFGLIYVDIVLHNVYNYKKSFIASFPGVQFYNELVLVHGKPLSNVSTRVKHISGASHLGWLLALPMKIR